LTYREFVFFDVTVINVGAGQDDLVLKVEFVSIDVVEACDAAGQQGSES
jgi:hypothetical protein